MVPRRIKGRASAGRGHVDAKVVGEHVRRVGFDEHGLGAAEVKGVDALDVGEPTVGDGLDVDEDATTDRGRKPDRVERACRDRECQT